MNVRSVVIQALSTNSGSIYIGGSDVDSTHAILLAAGASLTLEAPAGKVDPFIDLTAVYYDGATTADKINVFYLTNA
ncbi:MAG: hypothetical protein ACREUY_06160 [Burkholderiales bacterium]